MRNLYVVQLEGETGNNARIYLTRDTAELVLAGLMSDKGKTGKVIRFVRLGPPDSELIPNDPFTNLSFLSHTLKEDIYEAAVRCFEQSEHLGLIETNGHHQAQELASKAGEMLDALAFQKGYRKVEP